MSRSSVVPCVARGGQGLGAALAAAVGIAGFAPNTLADAFSTYGASYRSIAMPATGPGSSGLSGDALPDGRLIAVTGNSILLETGIHTGVFNPVATFDPAQSGGAADPAFVRLSPDGSRLAVGLGFGKPVAIVPLSSLGAPGSPTMLTGGSASYFSVPHFDGAWADSTHLAVTFGSFGSPAAVSILDTTSTPASPANPTVISNIGGASAGIAFDAAGRLYTGNGFDLGPGGSGTGTIRAFPHSAWAAAAGGGPAIDFETGGSLIGQVLSASSMLFDHDGNLIVGGGNFSDGDTGYLGVINDAALTSALAGAGPINTADPLALRRLTPTPDPFAFYGSAYNPLTGELYVTDSDFSTGSNTWYATVPTPSALILLSGAAAGLTARRRRHA